MNFSRSRVYISGTSRGLGLSLAEGFLTRNAEVIGLGRSSVIEHPNYRHHFIDLSSTEEVLHASLLEPNNDPEQLILINNSASLGEVAPFKDLQEKDIVNTANLNFIAPILLYKKFIDLKCNDSAKKYVLNIGTGAAQNPIDGWSMYCATKAGLLMFSRVLHEEIILGRANCRILDLAPGIIDTDMQAEIRQKEQKDFSGVDKFIEYNKEGELQTPEETARLIISNFESLFNKNNPSDTIRNYK